MTTAAPQTQRSSTTISLSDARAQDSARTGTKAARLAALLAADFDVPAGEVIPADLCSQWPGHADGVIPTLLEMEGPYAVRSSATAEDLEGASYAGLYATALDVADGGGLRSAIAKVLASAETPRVEVYDRGDRKMAVLVQRFVRPEAAGVAFTANPITGERDVVVVHAVRGPGEALVSGEVDPEEWEVREDADCLGEPEVLTAAQARAVAELARRVEEHEGGPCDIEWAFGEEKLWLLQARPITALPIEPELEDLGEGTWIKDSAHLAEPLTRFGMSIYAPALSRGMESACAEFGMLVERFIARSRGGEFYGRVLPVGGKEGKPPPPWLLGLLSRVVPPLRARMKAAREAIRGGKLESIPADWEERLRGEFQAEADALLDVELASLSDGALIEHLQDARALLERGVREHFRLFMPYVVAIAELNLGARELLGWEPAQTMRLLTGLSAASSAPTRALAALAKRVGDRKALRAALRGLREPAALEAIDPEFAAAFRAFERRHGWRTISYDPGSPTLAERPGLLASLILDRIDADDEQVDEERRARAEAEARAALADRPEALTRFTALLDAARRCYPLREDNVALTDNVPCGLLRRAMLEFGKRLVSQGRLSRPDDARWLSLDELIGALKSGEDLRSTTARRYAEYLWVRAHPGPEVIGPPLFDPPDTRYLPAEGRRMNRALLWFMDQELTPPVPSDGEGLRGRPGSAGKARGRVRVIKCEADFSKLQPGDVLVCPITSPVWSVLFANASALVTDAGGAMSHAAIIAREHGIPAVLATGDGTSRLRDGELVTVDGTRGLVTLER